MARGGRAVTVTILVGLLILTACSSSENESARSRCDVLAGRLHLVTLERKVTTAGRVTEEIRNASQRQYQDPAPQPLPTTPWSGMQPQTRVIRCALGSQRTLRQMRALPPSTLCPPEEAFVSDRTFGEYLVGPKGQWTKVDPLATDQHGVLAMA